MRFRHLLPTLAVWFVCLSGLAAHPATNGWQKLSLKGEVRSLTEHHAGGESYLYRFAEDGRLIYQEAGGLPFADLAELPPDSLQAAWDEYNEILLYRYEYDSLDRMTLREEYRPDSTLVCSESYFYSEEGWLEMSYAVYPESGQSYGTWYNAEEVMARSAHYGPDNELRDEQHYSYDESGQLREVLSYSDNDFQFLTSFYNDEHGNATRLETFDAAGNLIETQTVEYEYDDRGNIIREERRYIYDESNMLYLIERIFEYY